MELSMQKIKLVLILSTLLTNITTYAADSAVTTKAEPQINDNEIRSEMGSMSKYSLSSSMYYSGGSLDDPFGADQPNIQDYQTGGVTFLSGTFSLRYRMDKMSSLTISTGLTIEAPFSKPKNGDLSSPTVSYNRTNKMGAYLGRGFISAKYYLDEKNHDTYDKRFKFSTGYKIKVKNVFIKNLKFGLGVDLGLYTHGHDLPPGIYNATLYYFNVKPLVEYKISKKVKIKTDISIGRTNYRHYDSKFKFKNNAVSQTIGIGTGFTKEIYLYAFIITYPQNYRLDTSTIAMSLNFSVL